MNTPPLTKVKDVYAAMAQTSGRTLVGLGLMARTPPSRDHLARHWLHSLTRVHDSIAMTALDVPWWTYRAIDVVDVWLAARPAPAHVFEYGAGASTVWLSRRSASVHSVEHHAGFAEMLSATFDGVHNISLAVREPVSAATPAVGSLKEGHAGLDFSAYVDAIDDVDASFDMVVVDGRAREACLAKAVGRLAPGGIIVFDNSRRRRYRQAIAASGMIERRLSGLTPTLPYPDQTSVLVSRDRR